MLIFITFSCKKDKPLPPVLTTTVPDHIQATIATSGGNILSEGSSTVLRRGVCWSLNNTPTITNDTTFDGIGAGKFESHIKGLNYNATYFVKAYAINADGVGYGDAMSFKTPMAQLPTIGDKGDKLTNLTATSATTSQFFAMSDIGVPILSQGACWYVLKDLVMYNTIYGYRTPTISDNKSEGVLSPNILNPYDGLPYSYTATMTGLTENTLYGYSIYATNVVGTSYAVGTTFMTPPLHPTIVKLSHPYSESFGDGRPSIGPQCTATISYSNKVISSYGFCLSTSPHPAYVVGTWATAYMSTPKDNSYLINLRGLTTPHVINYVRAFVVYNDNTIDYSNEEFTW